MAIQKKSPFYWESLKELEPRALKSAFDECAAIDLGWAVDQAKTLAYNVRDFPGKTDVISAFCQGAAGKALAKGDRDTAVMALKVVADNNDDAGRSAAEQLRTMLVRMAEENTERALETAAYIQSSTGDDSPIGKAIGGFILDAARSTDSHKMLYQLIARGDTALAPEDRRELIDRAIFLAEDQSYDSYALISALLNNSHHLDHDQRRSLTETHTRLSAQPAVLEGILKHEHGEDAASAADIMAQLPRGNTVH